MKAKMREFLVLLTFLHVSLGEVIQYSGAEITVQVSQEIPRHLCWRFFNNLEVIKPAAPFQPDLNSTFSQFLLNSTSELLEQETSVPLTRITVELPQSMVSSACTANISLSRLGKESLRTDVEITGRDPVFGSSPYHVGSGGCGTRGRRVTLPSDRLLQADNVTSDTGEITAYTTSISLIITLSLQSPSSPPVWSLTSTESSRPTDTPTTASTPPPTPWGRSSSTTWTAGLTRLSSAVLTAIRDQLPPSRTCSVTRGLPWRS